MDSILDIDLKSFILSSNASEKAVKKKEEEKSPETVKKSKVIPGVYTGFDFSKTFTVISEEEAKATRAKRKEVYKSLRKRNGNTLSSPFNYTKIFSGDPFLKDLLAFNAFEKKVELKKPVPWRQIRSSYDTYLTNFDIQNINKFIDDYYQISSEKPLCDAIDMAAHKTTYHPILSKIEATSWDGIPRVESLLVEYLGAKDTAYTRGVTKKWLLAGLTRLYQPGTKFDQCLTLVGAQGIGKSTLLSKLSCGFFVDSIDDVSSQSGRELLQGAFIIEFAELAGLRKSDFNAVKNYITNAVDTYRAPYARVPEVHPRQCIFAATSNDITILRDPTGNRRFWIVECGKPKKKSFDLSQDEVLQIWAEVKEIYDKGSESLLLSEDLEKEAREYQELYREEDPWEESIKEYLDCPVPKNFYSLSEYDRLKYMRNHIHMGESVTDSTMIREKVCAQEIWSECLGQDKDLKPFDAKRIAQIIISLGWEKSPKAQRFGKAYGIKKGFIRKEED